MNGDRLCPAHIRKINIAVSNLGGKITVRQLTGRSKGQITVGQKAINLVFIGQKIEGVDCFGVGVRQNQKIDLIKIAPPQLQKGHHAVRRRHGIDIKEGLAARSKGQANPLFVLAQKESVSLVGPAVRCHRAGKKTNA